MEIGWRSWSFGLFWLLRRSRLSNPPSRYCSASAFPDLLETPGVEVAVGIIDTQEGEFGIVLFFFPDAILEDGPVSCDITGCLLNNGLDISRRFDNARGRLSDLFKARRCRVVDRGSS